MSERFCLCPSVTTISETAFERCKIRLPELGAAVDLGPGRHRIHLGSVDEIDTVIEGAIELRAGFVKRVLPTKGHGAAADFRDFQANRTKRIVFGSSHEPKERTTQMPMRPASAMGNVLHALVQS